jgi:hypothetical protein
MRLYITSNVTCLEILSKNPSSCTILAFCSCSILSYLKFQMNIYTLYTLQQQLNGMKEKEWRETQTDEEQQLFQ